MGKAVKTSKTSLAIASGAGIALLGGLWAFYTNPEINSSLTDADDAKRVLVSNDLKPVSVGGYAPLSCSRGEWFATAFTAKTAQGQTTSGAVCKTIFGRSRLSFH